METKFFKFPSIEQYRTVVHQVNHRARYIGDDENGEPKFNTEEGLMPTLKYRGSVKLHGTNASIVYILDELSGEYVMHAQSRKNVITPLKDNAGFAAFAHTTNTDELLGKILMVNSGGEKPKIVRVYGEWCGGNIQKGVALNGLDKMFVVFAIKIDDAWVDDDSLSTIKMSESRIFNILDFPTYEIEIDFNNPKESINYMVELTESIENECPVGKAFGNEVMVDNTAYEKDGKIWFENENGFGDNLKKEFELQFKEIRKESPNGVNYIKFNLE